MRFYRLLAAVFLVLLANTALAQEVIGDINVKYRCFNSESMFQALASRFKEVPLLVMQSGTEQHVLFSVWNNPTEKTWTLLITQNEKTCVMGAGLDYLMGTELLQKSE